jgi:hypothetical protein
MKNAKMRQRRKCKGLKLIILCSLRASSLSIRFKMDIYSLYLGSLNWLMILLKLMA